MFECIFIRAESNLIFLIKEDGIMCIMYCALICHVIKILKSIIQLGADWALISSNFANLMQIYVKEIG